MNSPNLDNLVKTGHVKKEPWDRQEFHGLLNSGKARLIDAKNINLSLESRFDLAYNAAHALALAALRYCGYRPANRYIVFQVLPQTLKLGSDVWRVIAKCHDKRNLAEYEGYLEVDKTLLEELIQSTLIILDRVEGLEVDISDI